LVETAGNAPAATILQGSSAPLCCPRILKKLCLGTYGAAYPIFSRRNALIARAVLRGPVGTAWNIRTIFAFRVMAYRELLTRFGTWSAHPLAFVIVAVYVLAWLIVSPETFGWHGLATVATWMMTLFIQRAEHRDTQAIHAKLDELLRVESRARDELTELDKKEPEEIETHREREQH
jgi:low affinity Fe/Cu permease